MITTSSRWRILVAATVAAGALAGAPGEAADPGKPRPFTGVALRGRTGLSLVVADRRPFVLDLDSGSVTRVRGVPASTAGVAIVVPVNGRGAAIVGPSGVHGLASPAGPATALGAGREVAPSVAGDAVWIHDGRRPRCTIRGVTLAGRTILRRRPFPCAATFGSGGRRGVVVNRTVLRDPATARVVLRTPAGVVAAAGTTLVLAGPGKQFTLFDSRTGRSRRVRWPSVIPTGDDSAADPRGRLVALGFATPSWAGTGKQVLDVWLLDTRTGRLTHVPGMPAFVALKETRMAWTDDGRLVFLARAVGRHLVAVWRPGEPRLAIRTIRLPPRDGGSDTFAPLG